LETEILIKATDRGILGMHGHGTNTGDLGGIQGSQDGVLK
jgi:hypothetical protein